MGNDPDDAIPSQKARRIARQLHESLARCFPAAVTSFDERWSAWHALCHSKTSADDDTVDPCLRSEEYSSVEKLGPKVMPMLVYKLASEPLQNSHGVYLYRALENDPIYQVTIRDGTRSRDELRQLANHIVQLNYQRYQVFRARLAAWHALCISKQTSSSYRDSTETNEFDELLDMGTSIIAPLMIVYHAQPSGWYWELLHEIIHGRKTHAFQFSMPELYASCEDWFNEGEHADAPVYQFSELERGVFSRYEGGRPPDPPPYERGNPRYW